MLVSIPVCLSPSVSLHLRDRRRKRVKDTQRQIERDEQRQTETDINKGIEHAREREGVYK